mgnify:CR=1 FL=1
MKCPKCNEEFAVNLKASIPKEQKISIAITKQDNSFIGAQTLGSVMLNMSETLKLVAKGLGEQVEVFVSGTTFTGKNIEVDFVVVKAEKGPTP